MELKCRVQEYAWGKVGAESEVAKLAPRACSNFQLQEKTPYAELWMGVHPNGPSVIAETGETLSSYLREHPEDLGSGVRQRFQDQLPFLFKVLSVNKALSIQAHPNKSHAEELFAKHPNIYKDPNHKPEIAVALTNFQGLCGFRPLLEIQAFLQNIPELRAVVGEENSQALINSNQELYEDSLKKCFQSLMKCDKELLANQLATLSTRIQGCPDLLPDLFSRLVEEFPGDVGCFVIYFLNTVTLNKGEAMYLGPNVPHAYLAGDCIECMANSDNVVRAGLTPKLIDVPTLVEMLDYRCGPAAERKFAATRSRSDTAEQPEEEEGGGGSGCVEFDPPVPDFAVACHQVNGSADCYTAPVRSSASIFIVTEGRGKYLASNQVKKGGLTVTHPYASNDLYKGSVLFLPADKLMEVFPEDCHKLVMYQAYATV